MSIEQNLADILAARYGKDVRQAIHDSIYDINEIAKNAEYHAETAPASAQAYANAALAAEQAAQDAKQAAQDAAAQAMSGTPAGYEQVVAEVRSLKTNEGTVLAQAGTFVGRVLLDKMYGMSVQNGTPTPSVPVAINSAKANFKNVGKNLLKFPYDNTTGGLFTVNDDRSITINGTGNSSFFLFVTENIKYYPYGRYTLSVEGIENAPNANLQVVWQEFNGNTWKRNIASCNKNNTSVSFSYSNTGDFNKISFQIQILASTTFDNLKIRPMLTFEGATTDYEPYVNNAVTTDLTLRAIEVTSSDDYNLVKDGHYYVADTLEKIDGGYQITRRCDIVTLDGTENMTWVAEAERDGSKFLYAPIASFSKFNNKEPKTVSSSKIAPAVSNRYTTQSGNTLAQTATIGFGFYIATNNYLSFRTPNITTSSDFKTWLASNNVEIVYVRETPTVEAISNADAKKLLSLKSYDEATYVAQTEDTEGVLVLEYGTTNFATKALAGYIEAEQNSIRLTDLESA